MKQVLVPSIVAYESVKVVRRRELPAVGTLAVRIGDSIAPNDIVARASVASGVHVVRATQQLGIEPHEIDDVVRVKALQEIQQGDVLAEQRGLFGLFHSQILSPVAGTVEYISEVTGHIGIRLPSKELVLKGYVKGTVTDVIENRGAEITTTCALVQGAFGIGGERIGILRRVKCEPNEVVRHTSLPDVLEGAILFGGAGFSIGALKHAAQRGVVGVVTGSVEDSVLSAFLGYELGIAITGNENVPLTLIVSEGFGRLPMNPRSLEILSAFEGSLASMNGATQVRAGAVRPEVLIFGQHEFNKPLEAKPLGFEIGARVRLIRYPHFGRFGVIEELPSELRRLDSGSEARVLIAKLDDGKLVEVPRANVELV